MIYTFYWAPEGKPLLNVEAPSYKVARKICRKEFPFHAKYMGEVYTDLDKPIERVPTVRA